MLRKALKLVWSCSPGCFWRKVIYVALQSLLPLLNLKVLQLLIDGITQGEVPYMYIGVFCMIFLANRLVGVLSGINNDVLSQRLVDYISDRIQQQSATLDMAFFDKPEYHDTLHRAQQEANFRPIQILNNFMALMGSVISISGITVMLATASGWVLVVMLIAAIPSLGVKFYKARSIYKFRRETTQDQRRTHYYSAVLSGREFAKELRSFHISQLFRKRFVNIRKQLVDRLLRISRRLGSYDALCAVVEMVALLFVALLLIRRTVAGAITIGSFVMLFEAFRKGESYMVSFVTAVAGLYDNRLFIGNLYEFLDLKPEIVDAEDPEPFPEEIHTVEFRDITFRYPDMQRDVLQHYSLTAHKGEVTLIQGENGFGKTTLLKLLLRLYDPQQGMVLINGTDLRKFAVSEVRRGVGALFQDYVRFYCTAAENIAFGMGNESSDAETRYAESPHRERIACAAERAGADTFIAKLPQGYDTPLGRLFDHGAELSMGQWQRVALARLYCSDAPVMIFDEPTAWMDVPSREKFYQTLEEIKQNKVIFLIKHV